ncbi:MAG: homocysteine biosynthesis protein, partial [Firmicutes bacterium]|nr:homocysteine biosynthesis protein [Bacillota bacterium]
DCYPRREIETMITLDDINEALLFNPRNAYQNYSCAVNTSPKTIYTYMGVLKSNLQNAHYSTSGQLSPLLKDPYFKTIGIGTRIFLGGGVGYVAWNGTQHFPGWIKDENGKELSPSGGTLAVVGDLKKMSPRWLAGASMLGYGASLSVGLGIPIPLLNEEVCRFAALGDDELYASIVDYSRAFPEREPDTLGSVSYAALKSGVIKVNGREVATAPMSSYPRAREIAGLLKTWMQKGEFLLGEPVELLTNADAAISGNALQG